MTRSKISKKIKKLTDHEKLVNLIAIHGEKDVNNLLQSVDRIFIEVFNLKENELPWISTNSDDSWDDFMRKIRLAFFKMYFEFVRKNRTYH